MNVPEDLRYAKSHEWFRPSDGAVGITDHAQAELSDVVYVELPKVGRRVQAGEKAAAVESVKAASDIYAPVAGTITGANETLGDDPGLVNRDPMGEGWFFRIRPKDAAEVDGLLDEAAYEAVAAAG